MSALGEVLGASVPHEFIHKGKAYTVSLVTQAVKTAFERRLFGKAREAAAAMRDLMSKEEFSQTLQGLAEEYQAGGFTLESERGQKALRTVPGMVSLCSLLFGTDEAEMLSLMYQRQEEVVSLVKLILKESFPEPENGEGSGEDPNG